MERSYVIKPELGKTYPVISHGKGIYLYDKEGKQYIDGCSGAVTALIGHAVDEVVDAMYEQAKSISFAYRSHFSSDAVEQLGKKLAEWAPGSLNWTFFVSSGSEATETAQKIAIQYWQEQGNFTKNRIISRWMSYHGITMGALSMSGHVLRRKRFVPLLEDYPAITGPYPYRKPEGLSLEEYAMQCANELETAILRVGPEQVAAFIAEPVIGATAGAVVPPPGYFQRIREICDKYNVLFIADEVMTGMGRTGKAFGVDHWGVVPDMITIGKGMSAGYTPMAATIVTEEIIEVIQKGSASIMAGHTYSANPQSAAVSLAVLNYIEKNNLIEKSAENGAYLLQRLQGLADELPLVGDARGLGMLCGLEFVKNKQTKEPFALSENVSAKVIAKAFEKGLLVYPAVGGIDGVAGDSVILAPPLTITQEEIDTLIGILKEAIEAVQQELQQKALIG
ncbi:aspartate aminotransferase family protein [Brevibacillus centrosporus]|uniref:aspartate aminotransferase family protein n=1 Tax=Brevibacillus centrosporus TaxID=54910 RepID=UPI002E1D0D52|nr:aspartate aminotransferase family protein [Brevibacillus centrosporus]